MLFCKIVWSRPPIFDSLKTLCTIFQKLCARHWSVRQSPTSTEGVQIVLVGRAIRIKEDKKLLFRSLSVYIQHDIGPGEGPDRSAPKLAQHACEALQTMLPRLLMYRMLLELTENKALAFMGETVVLAAESEMLKVDTARAKTKCKKLLEGVESELKTMKELKECLRKAYR